MQNSPNNGSRRAFLVSTRGDSTILLEETDSWTPVAWQGGTAFVLAAWDDALRDSFHFAFRVDSAGEWSLWTPDACRPSIKECFADSASRTNILSTFFVNRLMENPVALRSLISATEILSLLNPKTDLYPSVCFNPRMDS